MSHEMTSNPPMTNPMLAELDAVVRLMDAAPDCGWCDGSGEEEDDSSVGCGDRSCCSPAMTSCGECFGTGKRQGKVLNSSVFAFLRTHHATLADMAKRLEAAERDAKGERSESWEVWQDDMCVAGSDSLADAQHYMMMYGQDGPVKMVHVVTFRSDVIETVPADQLAIDATQEGEG